MSGQKQASISGNSASPLLAWLLQHDQYPQANKVSKTRTSGHLGYIKNIAQVYEVHKSLSP